MDAEGPAQLPAEHADFGMPEIDQRLVSAVGRNSLISMKRAINAAAAPCADQR